MKNRLLVLVLAMAPFGSAPALAQCGYGTSDQDCQHQQRDAEAARQAAYGVQQQQGQQQQYPGSQSDAGPPADPMGARVSAATAIFELSALEFERSAKLARDPRYQAYLNGEWKFFEDTSGKAPGQFCGALYWSKEGVVVLSGPGGAYNGALLTFSHPDFPRPQEMKVVKVSLWQTGDTKPQIVSAVSYTQGGSMGAISLAVPTLDLALDTMLDRQSFRLELDGKVILDLTWHDGDSARAALRKCYSARRR